MVYLKLGNGLKTGAPLRKFFERGHHRIRSQLSPVYKVGELVKNHQKNQAAAVAAAAGDAFVSSSFYLLQE